MSGSLTIRRAQLVLPNRVATGDIVIEDGIITHIGPRASHEAGEVVDGTGLTVMPGAIDPQVHFRDPGLTHKEDLASGSRAAAAGGFTAFLEMPNTIPNTTTTEILHDKLSLAADKSVVHYGFFIGATDDNIDELNRAERTCGIKIFMGASTGDLLVSELEVLDHIFANANKLVAVHAEDQARLQQRYRDYEGVTDPVKHPEIRDVQSAMNATRLAVDLAQRHGTRLHVLHVTSADEAEFLSTLPRDRISAEVCPQHLFLHAETAYATLGTRAQCNPPVRSRRHAEGLWKHLLAGTFDCIATDHAPHTLEEKSKSFPQAPSGMPGVEWALPLMLDRVNAGEITLNQVAKWMCEGPARCYGIPRKGRLEVGYDGDITVLDMARTRTVTPESVRSKCGWTPYEGWNITGWPVMTVMLGQPVFREGDIIEGVRGRELTFVR